MTRLKPSGSYEQTTRENKQGSARPRRGDVRATSCRTLAGRPVVRLQAPGIRRAGIRRAGSRSVLSFLRRRSHPADGNLRLRSELVDPVGDDELPRLQAAGDGHLIRLGRPRLNGADTDGRVCLHDPHERRFRPALERRQRDDRRIPQRLDEEPGVDELVGEEGVVFVGEDRLELDCPGRRIDLVVDRRQRPGSETRLEVAVESLDWKPPLHGEGPLDTDDFVLGDRERHGDGVDLRDDGDAGRVVGPHQVAGIDQPQADPAVDRRLDPAVVELELDVVDQRPIDLHRGLGLADESPLRVDLLLGHLAEVGERLGSFEIELHSAVGGLIAGKLRLGLPELHLVEPLIDLGQQFSGRDHLPFGKGNPHQFTIDPAADRDGVERRHRSQPVEKQLHVSLVGLDG